MFCHSYKLISKLNAGLKYNIGLEAKVMWWQIHIILSDCTFKDINGCYSILKKQTTIMFNLVFILSNLIYMFVKLQ